MVLKRRVKVAKENPCAKEAVLDLRCVIWCVKKGTHSQMYPPIASQKILMWSGEQRKLVSERNQFVNSGSACIRLQTQNTGESMENTLFQVIRFVIRRQLHQAERKASFPGPCNFLCLFCDVTKSTDRRNPIRI